MKRYKHNLSHYRLLTGDMGELLPVGLVEVLPGDTIQHALSAFIRVAPMIAPVMHPVRVRVHHWFVPHRLVWEDFESFITGGENGMDASVLPKITMTPAEGSLADYLGLPCGTEIAVNAIPFRAYALIYNEHYRDQDLQSKLALSLASGADVTTSVVLKNANWEKDYFTTSRPWEQKGTEISLPLGTTADVKFKTGAGRSTTPWDVYEAATGNKRTSDAGLEAHNPSGVLNDSLENADLQMDPRDTLYTDLSTATAATILQLREAFALQKFAEARARYGARYTEYLRYLGLRSSDARQQRPEYLGGGRQTIQFSEVLQTGPDFDANTGVGSMKGHGAGAIRTNRYRRFFEEHGYVISLLSVMPRTIYCQGVPKHWSRTVNEQFYQRELEDIGQDEVLNKEVYVAAAAPDGVFGYQDRYDEYRRIESGVAGEFLSSLDEWHMARIFAAEPALNTTFVAANPTKRMLAATGYDGLYMMVNNSIQARRMVRGGR